MSLSLNRKNIETRVYPSHRDERRRDKDLVFEWMQVPHIAKIITERAFQTAPSLRADRIETQSATLANACWNTYSEGLSSRTNSMRLSEVSPLR